MASGNSWQNRAISNSDQYGATGEQINNSLLNRQGYYQNNEDSYRGQADQAAADLAANPGYTSAESSAIMGNPGAGFGYYDPDQLTSLTRQGNSDVAGSTADYRSGLTDAAHGYGAGVTGAAGDWGRGVTQAAQQAKADLQAAPNDQVNWQNGVYGYLKGQNDNAVSGYGSALDASTDPSKLGLSQSFASDYKLSPEQAENIKGVAAQTTKGQYQRMSDQAGMEAAAQGNTSPAALAAIRDKLNTEGAAAAGDTAGRAELAANAEAANRAQTLESMRLGSQQDIASRQAANAGGLYNARAGTAQNLASLEQNGIQSATGNRESAAAAAAGYGYSAADTSGRAAYGAADQSGQMGYNAANQGGQAAINSGVYSASRDLSTAQGNQQTGQSLATGADAAGSARATGVAGQRIAGANNNLGYLTGQQGLAANQGSTATGQQIQNFGTQSGAQNNATQIGSQNQTTNRGQTTGLTGSLVSSFFKDGGIVTKPTMAVIGEGNRPEAVVPIGPRRYRMPKAA